MQFWNNEKTRIIYEGLTPSDMDRLRGSLTTCFEEIAGTSYMLGMSGLPLESYDPDEDEYFVLSIAEATRESAIAISENDRLNHLDFDTLAQILTEESTPEISKISEQYGVTFNANIYLQKIEMGAANETEDSVRIPELA